MLSTLNPIDLAIETEKLQGEFLKRCGHVEPTGGSMLPTEILAFIAACRMHGVNKVVESGRQFGYSTRCLLLMGMRVISYDNSPRPDSDAILKRDFPEAKILTGSCPMAIVRNKNPFALLLDGPKGAPAVQIVDNSNPTIAAIHDCHAGSVSRSMLYPRGWVMTDEFVQLSELDLQHLAKKGLPQSPSIFSECMCLGIAHFPEIK